MEVRRPDSGEQKLKIMRPKRLPYLGCYVYIWPYLPDLDQTFAVWQRGNPDSNLRHRCSIVTIATLLDFQSRICKQLQYVQSRSLFNTEAHVQGCYKKQRDKALDWKIRPLIDSLPTISSVWGATLRMRK